MSSKYLVAGYAIVDNVILYGDTEPTAKQLGGNLAYAASGIRLWEPSITVATYTGRNYFERYGEWYDANGLSRDGVVLRFDRMREGDLVYNERGTFTYYDKFPEFKSHPDMINAALFERIIGSNTKGVYAATYSGLEKMAEIFNLARRFDSAVGYEYEVGDIKGKSGNEEMLRECEKYLDFWSINYVESTEIFSGIRDIKDALELMCSYEKPIFFRCGTDGAYMIYEHKPIKIPMIDHFGEKDQTGCGNSSTSAAFWALCEGYSPKEAGYIGSVTASLNASYRGFCPKCTDELRSECSRVLNSLL